MRWGTGADKSAVGAINDSVGKVGKDVRTSNDLLDLQASERRFWAHRTGRFPEGLRMQMNHNPLQIEASGNGHMMQMRFAQPIVGRAAQTRGAHGLRDRPFDA